MLSFSKVERSRTVEVSREAWEQILVNWHRDPLAKLEEMSRAHWARFATEKVWRLYL
jgi:hypothetical protein